MSVAHLPWDSEFFGVTVARATLGDVTFGDAVEAARRSEVACLYVFIPGAAAEAVAAAIRAGAILVDLRTELAGPVVSESHEETRAATDADLPSLERMATDLAESSRFRMDQHFPADAVAEMYRIWVGRCLHEGVVMVPEDETPAFVGARGSSDEAHVELVYVASEARGARVAHRLIPEAVHRLGAASARVATQAGNVRAQRLYQSLGFRTRSVDAVLHLWLREALPPPGERPRR